MAIISNPAKLNTVRDYNGVMAYRNTVIIASAIIAIVASASVAGAYIVNPQWFSSSQSSSPNLSCTVSVHSDPPLQPTSGVSVPSGRSTIEAPTSSGLKVLATFFPVFDFARNIIGDKGNVSLLVPMGVDVHSFEPTPSTIHDVSTANVLVYNGAGLETWIDNVVSSANNPNLVRVDTSAGIPTINIPTEWQKGGRAIDPHIWLDPVLAKRQVDNILNGLIRADPANTAYFTSNAQLYQSRLDSLNQAIIDSVSNRKTNCFVTFHTAFGYFAKRYNLTQIAVFGPFQDSPSASDIQSVIDNIHRYKLCYVGYESLENQAIPQSIHDNTHAQLVPMNPIEGLTPAEQAGGDTYLTLMNQNLTNISLALNTVGCA